MAERPPGLGAGPRQLGAESELQCLPFAVLPHVSQAPAGGGLGGPPRKGLEGVGAKVPWLPCRPDWNFSIYEVGRRGAGRGAVRDGN